MIETRRLKNATFIQTTQLLIQQRNTKTIFLELNHKLKRNEFWHK